MEKLTHYRHLLKQQFAALLELLHAQPSASGQGIETQLVIDDERDQYLIIVVGWSGSRRVRATTLYARIVDDKIWIEEDFTEDGFANRLLRSGVPHQDIVLAFQPPSARKHTEFAAT